MGNGLLQDKIALVYGGAGSVGATAAATFAREGATAVLVGRTETPLEKVAEEIWVNGGKAETAVVDASDRTSVEDHLDDVLNRHGRLDVSLNATSLHGETQGTPLGSMDVDEFTLPARTALVSNFHTATAAASRMTTGGVILTMSTSAAGLSGRDRAFHKIGGFGVACAAVEAFTLTLAGEVGGDGIRVVCLRPDALPETWGGVELDATITESEAYRYMTDGTALGRMPKLQEVADTAAFIASNRAGAITGTVINLTCGSIMP